MLAWELPSLPLYFENIGGGCVTQLVSLSPQHDSLLRTRLLLTTAVAGVDSSNSVVSVSTHTLNKGFWQVCQHCCGGSHPEDHTRGVPLYLLKPSCKLTLRALDTSQPSEGSMSV